MNTAPLVLIHGFPLDHRMWSAVQKALPSAIKVLAPDLPGFAGSPIDSGIPAMDGYVEYVARYLKVRGEHDVVLAGTSMGGYVALAFAQKYPDRVRGIALIDSQSKSDTPETVSKRQEQIANIRAGKLETVLGQLLPKLFSPEAIQFHSYARECAQSANPEGLINALEAMAARPDRTEWLQQARIPISIIHASKDEVIPLDKAHKLFESISGATWAEVAGGHSSPMEDPKGVAEGLIQLMQKVIPNGKLVSDTKQYRPGLVWSPSDKGL
ncbi:MAG: alpha/beta fold hydrolase [Verrucomicrobiales bacterium]|nr:alpha/beta fold hydrolase [Verrucomicrobiales bacterium]